MIEVLYIKEGDMVLAREELQRGELGSLPAERDMVILGDHGKFSVSSRSYTSSSDGAQLKLESVEIQVEGPIYG